MRLCSLMGCLKYIYLHVNIINLENLEVCSILGYYAAKSEFFLYFLTLEHGIDRLFRNVGKNLPLFFEYYPRRAQIAPEACHFRIHLLCCVSYKYYKLYVFFY
jgi:hypothetical protein